MSVCYLGLVDYIAIATEATGLDVDTVTKVADLGLADSALHAPMAEFGGTELRSPPATGARTRRRRGFVSVCAPLHPSSFAIAGSSLLPSRGIRNAAMEAALLDR